MCAPILFLSCRDAASFVETITHASECPLKSTNIITTINYNYQDIVQGGFIFNPPWYCAYIIIIYDK